MKRLLLASTALVFGGQAFAADLPIKAPRIAAPVAYSWSSCYVGGHVGVGRNRASFTEVDGFANTIPVGASFGINGRGGALGGVQVGCDYQFASNWVFGVAGDFSWANIQGSGIDAPGLGSVKRHARCSLPNTKSTTSTRGRATPTMVQHIIGAAPGVLKCVEHSGARAPEFG